MTPEQFCYWLQGFMEVSGAEKIDPKQLAVIKEHLQTVFNKVTTVSVTDGVIGSSRSGSGIVAQGGLGGIIGTGYPGVLTC